MATAIVITTISSCKKEKDDNASSRFYFSNYNAQVIGKVDLSSSPIFATTLFDNNNGLTGEPEGITLTKDGFLIAAEENGNRILKMKKNGTGAVTVLYDEADGVKSPTAITVDNIDGKIYWCNNGTKQIMEGSTNGKDTPVALYNGSTVIDYAYGIAVDHDGGMLYFCDFSGYISAGKLDGTGTPTQVWTRSNTSMSTPSNVALDTQNKLIYWTDEGNSSITVGNMDGTGTPVVLYDSSDGISRADGIFIDKVNGMVYWSETSSFVIARAKLDGSGTREVLVQNIESYCILPEIQ
jgi:sugar lactone lactonase YvrE